LDIIEELKLVVKMLANGEPLPKEYRDHELKGTYSGHRECHIEPDWLLIYKISEQVLVLSLVRTGSHSKLFRK
jgi:mRNA interferase YafQ